MDARRQQPTDRTSSERREVVVVGGGQAGLALGYFLARQGRDFVILEAAKEPAAAWRERWDSLKLFTAVRYNSLPGLNFPGEPASYPGRDDVAAYLTDYVRHFDLPVELGSRVRSIRKPADTYHVELDDRSFEAQQVVDRHRPVPGPVHASHRPGPRPQGGAATQHRVPVAAGHLHRPGPRRRRWQHRLSDRRRARGCARGPSVDRLASDAAAPAHPRPRPVLVPREERG